MNAIRPVALAIVAHPDDIEFHMAGTLLLLKDAGAEIHMWNLANGSYGTTRYTYREITAMRWAEAQDAAREAGATIYPPICDDLSIFYEQAQIAQVASVIREVRPTILLTHSPQDYMEDHMIASRLAVTAAFARGMPNFSPLPPVAAYEGDITIYHAMPHGLRNGLRERVRAEIYVDITSMLDRKRAMLTKHRSQKDWLDVSQGMDSYLMAMEDASREVGRLSGRFETAEGFRRHLHLGFSARMIDPLSDLLGAKCWSDPTYEKALG